MAALAKALEELAVGGIAGAEGARALALLQQAFQVVEHQQAALPAQVVKQQGELLVQAGGQRREVLGGEDLQPAAQQIGQGRSIQHGAPEHAVKVRGEALDHVSGQSSLACAAHGQQSHDTAAVGDEPALKSCQFRLPTMEAAEIRGLAPILHAGRTAGLAVHFAGLDLLVKSGRVGIGLHAQFVLQQAAAGVVVGQGSVALPAVRQ